VSFFLAPAPIPSAPPVRPFLLFLVVGEGDHERTDAHVQDPFLRLHMHGYQLCRATTIKLLRPRPPASSNLCPSLLRPATSAAFHTQLFLAASLFSFLPLYSACNRYGSERTTVPAARALRAVRGSCPHVPDGRACLRGYPKYTHPAFTI
jgi:hypothetical protein